MMTITIPNTVKNNGYYIYLLKIDTNNNISLINTRYINNKLKKYPQNRQLNEYILCKVLNSNEESLFESKLFNPKIIYAEDFLHSKSVDYDLLDSTYFTIKVPAFNDLESLEFSLSSKINNIKNKKLNKINLYE